MAKQTVQGLILDRIDRLEEKMDRMIPLLEGLKIKVYVISAIISAIGTAIMSAVTR